MKKILQKSFVSVLLLFVFQLAALAQVTIGSGTSTQRFPFSYYYGYTRTADIYTASEMNTVTTGGTITTISWYSTIASSTVGPTIIYLKQVGATTAVASATWTATIAGATTVYTATPASWVIGWNSIDITDYPIAAGQNLEVMVEANFGGSGAGGGTATTAFYYSTGATDCHAYWQADTSPPDGLTPAGSSLGAITTAKPNVILGGLTPPPVPDCATLNTPSNGAAGVALNAPLTWTAAATGGSATGYKVYLGTVNPPTTLISTVTAPTTTYTPSGQAYSTTYYWYVVPVNLTGDAVGCNATVNSYTTMAVPPPPANDNCAAAVAFAAIPVNGTCVNLLNQTTVSATASGVTPTGACTSNSGNPDDDVWFSFVASAPIMDLSFTYVSGATDIYWHVYSGSCGASMTSLFCSDADAGGSLTGLVVGQTYYIKMYTYQLGVSTVQSLCLKATPMTYVSSTTTQVSTASVSAGTLNAQILRTVIVVTGANTPMTLTQLNLNTNGSTNAATDLLNAKVYYTGSSTTFSTTTQFGTVSLSPNGSYIVTGSQALAGGSSNTNNYFFITYDLSCTATAANVVDGEVTSFVLDGVTQVPTVTAPANNRAITALYAPTRTDGNSTTAITGGAINNTMVYANITGSATCPANITNVTGAASGTFVAGDVVSAKCYYTTSSTFTIGTAVQFGSTIVTPASGASLVFTGSQALASGTGNYFWILYDISCSATNANTVNATINSLDVGASTYTISTGTISANAIAALYAPTRTDGNSTTAITVGTLNATMVYGSINGSASCPANITRVDFTVSGTNPAVDINAARCYYTTTSTFSTANLFGTAIANPAAGSISFTGAQALAAGANYFWLVYDINCAATATNTVNGDINAIYVGSTSYAVTGTVTAANAIAALGATYSTVADGDWASPGTWTCGFIPPTNSTAVNVNHNVTVTTAGNVAGNVTVAAGKTLTISSGDLTLGASSAGAATGNSNKLLVVNGTLTMSAGILNINGGLRFTTTGYTFNMTGGTMNIDGNDGTSAGSLATTGSIYISAIGTHNVTGGNINILDPVYLTTSTTSYAIGYSTPTGANNDAAWGTGCTVTLGGGDDVNTSNLYGFQFDCNISQGTLNIGRLIVNSGDYAAKRHMSTSNATGNLTVVKNLTVNAGSEIVQTSTSSMLAVTGDLVNNGLITIANATVDRGLVFAGDMQYSGAFVYVPGTAAQSLTGTGFFRKSTTDPIPTAQAGNYVSTFTVYHLKTSPGVTLGMPITAAQVGMRGGKINTTVTNILALGNGTALPGTAAVLTATTGTLNGAGGTAYTTAATYSGGHVAGPFNRWVTATTTTGQQGLMPVGADTANVAQISFTTAPATGGYLTANWIAGSGNTALSPTLNQAGVTPSTISLSQNAKWTIDNNGTLTGGTYTASMNNKNASGVLDFANTVLLKRASGATGSVWEDNGSGAPIGTHVASTGSNTSVTVGRSGLTTFSAFSIGGGVAVLPISIEYFTGRKQAAVNVLDWKVNSSSASTLTLERSTDRVNYKVINVQAASIDRMLTPFTYTDAAPAAGVNYYRLKITNADGESKYSNVVALVNKDKGFELISIAPNPVQHSTVLSLSSVKAGKIELSVSDITGKVVMKQSVSVIAGNNPITLNFAILAAGTYQITAIDADGDSKSTRFVKF